MASATTTKVGSRCEWMFTVSCSDDQIHLSGMPGDTPVSLCHLNSDMIKGIGPVFASNGMNLEEHCKIFGGILL
jgi:hypothetical protein